MSFSNDAIKEMLGKTISGVVFKENVQRMSPRKQIFLVFSDNTYFEIYGSDELCPASGLVQGGIDKVRSYMSPPSGNMKITHDVSLGENGQIETKV